MAKKKKSRKPPRKSTRKPPRKPPRETIKRVSPLGKALPRPRGRPRKTSNAPQQRYTPRMQLFVDEYFAAHMDGHAAALAAGYSPKSARSIASQLLNKPLIRNEIEKRLRHNAKKADISAERVLTELGRLGFSDLRDVLEWTPHGVRLRSSEEVTEDAARALASIKETRYGMEIRLHDKRGALELLGRHLGLFKDPIEGTVEIQVSRAAEDFAQRLASVAKRLGVETDVGGEKVRA